MKNILVVNVNWLGDVIFSTPVFRALREKYPEARIACMAVPRVAPVLECCPYIDDVIIYDERGRHRWPWAKMVFIARLRRFHFDIAFFLHRSWTRAFLVYLDGVRQRVGYDLKDLGRLLTHKVELSVENTHRSDYYLHVIEDFGVEVKDRTTEIFPDHESGEQVKHLLMEQGISAEDFVVVVNIGGNWHLKRWVKENFAALIAATMKNPDIKVVIPGAEKDMRRATAVKEMAQTDPVILAGKTHLKQTFALMERADVVVSADSGPLHIASSVGTTTIAIFGPTRPEITGPRGKGRSIVLQKQLDCNQQACYQLDCPDNKCMKAVTVDEVVNQIQKIYDEWKVKNNK